MLVGAYKKSETPVEDITFSAGAVYAKPVATASHQARVIPDL
ncbi:hypothetical protein HMPREF3192_00536 [Atopobium deltae]|uniref:Uncharacterized protein n=1 Tax=Atopobium deltae TaxID=1393034 RepID=A0A133XW70_9ACTN|nr:hypothetical protein HMPREF3192_00536 [Atopobium deltae]